MFQSTIDTDYVLVFQKDDDDDQVEIPIKNHEFKAVPIDFIKGSVQLKAQGSETLSSKYFIQEFISDDQEKQIEIKCGNNYIITRTKPLQEGKKAYHIVLDPHFQIKNCCPVPLEWELFNDINGNQSVVRKRNVPP